MPYQFWPGLRRHLHVPADAVYLYDLRHTKTRRAARVPRYFFILPNYYFLLFPVIDFQTMRRRRTTSATSTSSRSRASSG
jgi:alginate O-acetyltransferase complex protein AlgI